MAGAGGLLVILVGALLGLIAGVATVALFMTGFSRMSPARSRAAAYVVGGLAFVALLLTAPAWIVIVSGKDTRGEAFDRSEIDLWIYLVLVTPPGALAALATYGIRRRRRRHGEGENRERAGPG
jgi:hypothetical protein